MFALWAADDVLGPKAVSTGRTPAGRATIPDLVADDVGAETLLAVLRRRLAP